MNKKVLSIILLCLTLLSFIFALAIFIDTGISLNRLENTEIDMSKDILPGVSIIGVIIASSIIWLELFLFGGITSSIGFACSLVNTKISQNIIIRRISKAFLCFYSVVLVLIFSHFVYFIVSIVSVS